jgi:hypothetical protein
MRHERRFEKLDFPACVMMFFAFLFFYSTSLQIKKELKKLTFSVKRESQWTNVDDYHPLWMIIVQYG